MGKVVIGVLCLVFLLGLSGSLNTGIHNLRVDAVSQTFTVVTTDNTTASVVLSRAVFSDELTEISAVTSSIVETPVAATYTALTKTLLVSGLELNTSRTLTVAYSSEKEDTIMMVIGPFLTILIFGGILGAIIYYIWKGKRG